MELRAIKSVLLASRLRIAAVVMAGMVVLSVVIVGAGFATGVLGVPSVESVDNEFADVNATTTTIRSEIVVDNPNPVGSDVAGLSADYTVSMNGVEMATGRKGSLGIGSGRSTVVLDTYMDNRRIPDWWVTHIRNDERTDVTIDASVSSSTLLGASYSVQQSTSIETDVISKFNSKKTREVDADITGVEDPVLYINETAAEWGEVTDDRTPIDMAITVYNPKPIELVVSQISYEITMNGITVGQGQSDEEHVLPAKTETVIRTQTAITNDNLDEWWVSHLQNDQVTDLRIDFGARVEAGQQALDVPLDALNYEETIETDIFGGAGGGNASDLGPDDVSDQTPPVPGTAGAPTGSAVAALQVAVPLAAARRRRR